MSLFERMGFFRRFLTSAFSLFTAIFAIACAPNTSTNGVNSERVESKQERLRILAIGDGHLANFSLNNLSISRGRFTLEEGSKGDSLPAFFVRHIERIAPKRVESYLNLSLVASSALD